MEDQLLGSGLGGRSRAILMDGERDPPEDEETAEEKEQRDA